MSKYFKLFIFMLFGHVIAQLIVQQQFSNERILLIILSSILAAFFWWFFDWSASKRSKPGEE